MYRSCFLQSSTESTDVEPYYAFREACRETAGLRVRLSRLPARIVRLSVVIVIFVVFITLRHLQLCRLSETMQDTEHLRKRRMAYTRVVIQEALLLQRLQRVDHAQYIYL